MAIKNLRKDVTLTTRVTPTIPDSAYSVKKLYRMIKDIINFVQNHARRHLTIKKDATRLTAKQTKNLNLVHQKVINLIGNHVLLPILKFLFV